MINKIVIFLFILATTEVAIAADSRGGLFLEPAITYESGETDVNYPSPLSNSTGESTGLGLGARIGFHISEAFFLAFDGRYSKPQFKDSSVSYDEMADSMNWGPVIGMQMPNFGIRIWGTYVMGGSLDPESAGNFDVKFKNAKGYRVGLGFLLEVVSLNLEYENLSYDSAELQKVGPFSSVGDFNGVDLDNNSWIVSVSFPMSL